MTRIAHLSDLHLSPVPFPAEWPWRLKPVLGWINWRRQPGAHDNAMAARTIAAVAAAGADHIAVTGDLIELGLTAEYAAAKAALAGLGHPARVAWAPGNHDCYTTDTRRRIRAALGDWLAPGPAGGDLRAQFPRLDLVGRAALVTLCSGTPTWTFSAEGELGPAQLDRLDRLLAGLDRTLVLPVIAIHHPPEAPGLSRLKRLRDGSALLGLLARHRCPLLLHGHLHEACRREVVVDGQTVTCIGAPSASATGRHGEDAAGFTIVTVTDSLSWTAEMIPTG
ncbi:metallophosphoesterase family protein [Phreatobacter sp.]|uniref:metallophosphoesterase family protein n=1 Tax=Phreatobacter sp. TaxID=1966341 RepID=UPI003F6F3B0F